MKPILQLKDVSKIYKVGDGVCVALHDINLDIHTGELLVIVGPSGSGKSTLLNLIGALDSPSKGKIFMNDIDISSYSNNELSDYRAKNVGFIFQFYNLIPTLTAYENVAINKELVKDSMDPKIALKAVGLGKRMHHFPSQLSGGEQQRASIARAIAKKPEILLCDEPTGALDTTTGQEVLAILQECSQKFHKTVILVTHNSEFAAIADRVVRLRDGKIESITVNENKKDASEVHW